MKPLRKKEETMVLNRRQLLTVETSGIAAEGSAVPRASTHEPGHRAPIDVGRCTVLRARATVGHDPSLRLTTRVRTEENTDGLWRRPGL
jgi:hypothetical protein